MKLSHIQSVGTGPRIKQNVNITAYIQKAPMKRIVIDLFENGSAYKFL